MGDSSFVIVREHIVSIFQLSLRCPKRKKPFCQNTLKTPKNLRSRETLKMKKKSQKKRKCLKREWQESEPMKLMRKEVKGLLSIDKELPQPEKVKKLRVIRLLLLMI